MSNQPIITPGGSSSSGPATPAAGSVTPATISQTPVPFVFPQDVTVGRNVVGTAVPLRIVPGADGFASIEVTQADGSTYVLVFDTTNRRVGILTNTPGQPLDVNGNVKISGQMVLGANTPSGACLIDMINPYVGLGIPVMTSAQKTAVNPNRAGNLVFDTDLGKVCVNNGSAWQTITSA